MSTILTNGLKLPDKGSVDWYSDMQNNYTILDGAVGTIADHTTALAGKAPAVHTHTKSDVTDLFNSANEWTGSNVYSSDSLPVLKLKNTSLDISSLPASNLGMQIGYLDKNNVVVGGWNYIKGPDGTTRLYCELATQNSNNQEIRRTLRLDTDQNGVNWQFYPSSADINLGTSTNQWKSVYAQSYYYNGVAWGLNVKNNWTHYNAFNGYRFMIKQTSQEIGVLPSSNQWNGFSFVDKNEQNTISFQHAFLPGETRFSVSMVDNVASHDSDSTVWIEFLKLSAYSGGSGFIVGAELRPSSNNFNLGTSTNKWKSLNGINPGALSLPGEYGSSVTEYITDKTGGNNAYTAPADGWVGIQAYSATLNSENFIFMGRTSDGSSYYQQNASSPITAYWSNQYHGCILLPVISGKTYGIRCKCDTVDARFYKANGNVS